MKPSFRVVRLLASIAILGCLDFTQSLAIESPREEDFFNVPLNTVASEPSYSLYFKTNVRMSAFSTSIPIPSSTVTYNYGKQNFDCHFWTETSPTDREIKIGTTFKIIRVSQTIVKESIVGAKSQSITLVLDSSDSEFKYLGLNCEIANNRIFRKNMDRDFSVGVFNLAFESLRIHL